MIQNNTSSKEKKTTYLTITPAATKKTNTMSTRRDRYVTVKYITRDASTVTFIRHSHITCWHSPPMTEQYFVTMKSYPLYVISVELRSHFAVICR